MNYYPLFRVRSWNNGVRCMSFYILMNLWYGRIASWDIRVLVVFAPNLALCHWHAVLLPCYVPYWRLTPSIYVFIGIVFRRSVWKACFPILLAHGEIPASGSMPPSRCPLPPHEKYKIEQGGGGGGGAALHLNQARGNLNWRMCLPALLGGNLGCRIV